MAREVGVIGQVRVAAKNPVALFVGCMLGGFVPSASFSIAHYETESVWSLQALLVLGGLIYSAKTVHSWGKLAFSCAYKATGFVVLIEGVMVMSKSEALSYASLAYLIAINAIATGCTLALKDAPPEPKKARKEKAAVSAPMVEEAPVVKPKARARKARSSSRDTIPAPSMGDASGEFEIAV